MTTHTNSMLSSREVERFDRRQIILDVYSKHGALTDREVAGIAGFSDMNSVRPRITEMIEEGILMECGADKDHLTGRRVRLVTTQKRYTQLEMGF